MGPVMPQDASMSLGGKGCGVSCVQDWGLEGSGSAAYRA